MTLWLEELVIMEGEKFIDWRSPSEMSDYIAPSKKTETEEK